MALLSVTSESANAIPAAPAGQDVDAADAEQLYRLLETEVVPLFYDRDAAGVPRRWVEQDYNVTHWREQPRGGHFAAMEVPDVYVDELRTFFRTVR